MLRHWIRYGLKLCALAAASPMSRHRKSHPRRRLFESLEPRLALSGQTASLWFQDASAGYAGTLDTYIRAYAPTTSYGAATSLNVDTSDTNGRPAHALLRFDEIFGETLSQIPADAEISAASLVLYVSNPSTNTLSLNRMLVPWEEDVTWASAFGANGIQADGLEALAPPDGTLVPTSSGRYTIDVTASLRAWAANPAGRYGWALLPGGSDGVDISSAENGTAGNRPQLNVTFTTQALQFKTHDADSYFLTPIGSSIRAADSGSAATAIATGVKTDPGNISWKTGDPAGGQLQSIAERLRAEQGFSIGVVTTVGFSDATPAAMVSHNVDRDNLTQIADEIIRTTQPEVVIGGGHPGGIQFNYLSLEDYDYLRSGTSGYTFVERTAGVDGAAILAAADTVDPNQGQRLFGLFGVPGGDFSKPIPADLPNHPAVARGSIEDPTLTQATQAALTVLARDNEGFFALIEQGETDHANHDNDYQELVDAVWDLDQSVRTAMAMVDQPGDSMDWTNTLLIVTADHANSYMRLAQPLGPGDLPIQRQVNGQWDYPAGEVLYGTDGHTNELVSLQAIGAGAGLFRAEAGAWYPGTQIVDDTRISAVISAAVAAGTKNVILFIGDGMQMEHEIAGSRYLYGADRALAWHAWNEQPDGWAGFATTWDVKTYDKYAMVTSRPAYDPARPIAPGDSLANDPLLGYDLARGGTAPYPLPGSFSLALNSAAVVEDQPPGSIVGNLASTESTANGALTYSLVSGAGSDDNAAFTLVGNQLQTNAALDYETRSSYNVRVRAADQGDLVIEKAFTIRVIDLNEAPSLSSSQAAASVPIREDDATNGGSLISEIISSAGGDLIADPDLAAVEGIAITGSDQTCGRWEYRIGETGLWTALAAPSPTAARLLASDSATWLRFLPNPDWNGTVARGITFCAWDQSSGVAGDVADTTYRSGNTAFSLDEATISVIVAPVNDPPVFTKGADQAVPQGTGPRTVSGWATNISPGPADEALQTLSFRLSTSNDALFATLPTITPDGSLTFAPVRNRSGAAVVSVYLEDDGGTADGGSNLSPVQTFTVTIQGTVAGRCVFYNNSWFDSDPTRGRNDDNAIAVDKQALLPGQKATFANYTSYNKGLNGIMIDVAGLAATPAASDFQFRCGNAYDVGSWLTWYGTPTISVRPGEGTGGADRISIVWPDYNPIDPSNANNAPAKTWLQVTVLATANTGLAASDVFYFGNAIGESGNSTTTTYVDASDFAGARDNPHSFANPATISDPYDYNRDRYVNGFDLAIVRDNSTNFLSALKLITAPLLPSGGLGTVSNAMATNLAAADATPAAATVDRLDLAAIAARPLYSDPGDDTRELFSVTYSPRRKQSGRRS